MTNDGNPSNALASGVFCGKKYTSHPLGVKTEHILVNYGQRQRVLILQKFCQGG